VEARVQKLAGRVKGLVCAQRGLALCGYNASEAVTRASVMDLLSEGKVREQLLLFFVTCTMRAGFWCGCEMHGVRSEWGGLGIRGLAWLRGSLGIVDAPTVCDNPFWT
jgi:hypothetical protein